MHKFRLCPIEQKSKTLFGYMEEKNKNILLRLLQQHKELGISEQIDYQKVYLDLD